MGCEPLSIVWQGAVFLLVIYPLVIVASLFTHPVRMSRVSVFLSAIFCALWSVTFLANLIFKVVTGKVYTLAWNADRKTKDAEDCICFCMYPLRDSTVIHLVQLDLVVLVCSANIALRALKGLRYARWANLFSLLYSVPIEIFPVEWERPEEVGGGPIRYRS